MDKFWASTNGTELLENLNSRVEDFDQYLETSGVISQLRDSHSSFYGDSRIRDVGSQGELKAIKINHYASLIRNLVSLVTNNKPAWQPIASNTDVASQGSAVLASGLLDFYMKDRRLDRMFRNACLMSCFMREAFVAVTWDSSLGEVVYADEATQIHEGDLSYKLFQLNDVIRDVTKSSSEYDWIILREEKNKWELIAQFPEYEDRIKACDERSTRSRIVQNISKNESDEIPFYTFFIKPSNLIPQGRMVTFVESQILFDGPLPYDKIPVVRLSAEENFESIFAHAPMMDVLPVQKAIDSLASTLLTNNNTFGVQNIQVPKGNSISVSSIGGGLNLIEYDAKAGRLEPLQLTASAPETYRFFDLLVNQSQLLSGINDAIRGQSSAGTSGAALALLSQQAIQYSNGLQQGYVSLIEDVGTLSIQILKKYANTQRVATLTGKHNRPLLKEWSAEDLKGISRITIESGNALSKTSSGRLTMADSLLQSGMIKRPEQYIAVLTTGQLEPIYENEQSQLLLIRAENEKLSEGQPVRAILTDEHANHILEHSSVLSNPEIRENNLVVQSVLTHIQEHMDLAQGMSPVLAQLLKQQPLPPPSPAPQLPAEVMNNVPSIETQSGDVNLPSLPTNPATGEQVPPVQG